MSEVPNLRGNEALIEKLLRDDPNELGIVKWDRQVGSSSGIVKWDRQVGLSTIVMTDSEAADDSA